MGIGAGVWTVVEFMKPFLKGLFAIPWLQTVWAWTAGKIGVNSDMAYLGTLQGIAFVLGFVAAYAQGPNGDLFVKMGWSVETTWVGYVATAAVIAFGNVFTESYYGQRAHKQGRVQKVNPNA